MQRVRRLASVAVIATLAVSGLSACRTAPDVAVYYGNTAEISMDRIQDVYDDARTKLEAAQAAALEQQRAAQAEAGATPETDDSAAPQVQVPFTTADVVSALVGNQVARKLAQQNNVAVPATLPLDRAGPALGLPTDAEYLRLFVETDLIFTELMTRATPAQASDDDLRKIFEAFEAGGAVNPGVTFEEFKSSIPEQGLDTVGRAVAVSNDVRAELDQLDVKVNPRFDSAEVAIYSEGGGNNAPLLTLVGVPLTDTDSVPVTDLR